MRKIGAHVSASGGIDKALERAKAIGANCVQVFSASPRIWKKPSLDGIDPTKIEATKKATGVEPIITHALYLINLASDKSESVQKSIDALNYELQFDAKVHGAGVVVHLGSHQGRGWETVKDQVAQAIKKILEATPSNSTFLIENSAGQKGKLCSDLSEIRWLLDEVKSDRLGWCLDTCHAFCAGYPLSPRSQYMTDENVSLEEVISKLHLWQSLKCIHVNDSRDPFASGKDRHQNLGDGSIPTEDFKHFLSLKSLEEIPLMIEVPGLDKTGPDEPNISRLKKLTD